MSHCVKLFSSVNEKRTGRHVLNLLGEWQYGLRPGRCTSDLIFVMKMMFKKIWDWGKDKFALFNELEKAFDCVSRNLPNRPTQFLRNLIRVLKGIYSKRVSQVRKGDVETDCFRIETGVRQGERPREDPVRGS